MEKNKKTTTLLAIVGIVGLVAGLIMLSATSCSTRDAAPFPLIIGLIISIIDDIRWWKQN